MDIQVQNGKPVMWAVTKPDAEEVQVGIAMQGTGMDVLAVVDELNHVSTTQCGSYVWHWFTDFGYDYGEECKPEAEFEIEFPD